MILLAANTTLQQCFPTLTCLRKIKRYASCRVRKQLVESLILSKRDYRRTFTKHLSNKQKKNAESTK